jgi:hypothetical protein
LSAGTVPSILETDRLQADRNRKDRVFDIFVSYRTMDARFGAAATYELLTHRFGRERVFLDNQSMSPGADYPRSLRDALESMRVLLALIGPTWLADDPTTPGRRLIDRDRDWVRREIRRAFARGVAVVPVLLDGAGLPSPDELPDDVRRLVHCQVSEVRHQQLGTDVRRLGDAVDVLLAAQNDPTDHGGRSRVHDADEPVRLGVHPSPVRAPSVARTDEVSLRAPDYVPRDAAERLAWALTATSFVLIVGDATAGKSRLAYEVVRQSFPDHWLVVPERPADLPGALAWARATGDCVVWLDDIERYLGPDGLTVQTVSALNEGGDAGRVLVLGTIRTTQHALYSPRGEALAGEPGRLGSRLGRDVVRLAYEIYLSRLWSPAEVERASMSADPRVTEAARHADEFGVAEYLAAGPQLLAEWRDAWSPGNHPRAAALVAAAVDVSRAGVRRGVGIDLLRRLHGHYLAARGGPLLRPEPFDDALSWATRTLHATSSLLVPVERGRYRPFGYLTDAVAADLQQADVQDNTWRVLITRMSPADCWYIGEAAYASRQLQFAQSAFRRTAAAGNRSAELKVIDCIGESGQRIDAVVAVRDIIAERTRSEGPRHPDTIEARQVLAGWTGRTGDPRSAIQLLEEIVRDLSATVGPGHPDTLTARHALANWMGRAGHLADAVAEYERLVTDRTRRDGPHHPHTLSARHDLANWLGRTGRIEQAVREHEDIAAARLRVLGSDHPDSLRSRHRWARLVCEVRGTEVGLPLVAQVVADRVRVLGRYHPDSLRSQWQYVRWTGKSGDVDEAVRLAEQLAADSARALGAHHPDTLRARHQHARWTSESGHHADAVALFRDLIADWQRLLGSSHPYTLISRYRLALAVAGTGARADATELVADLAADNATVLGEHHPHTQQARELLARWANAETQP